MKLLSWLVRNRFFHLLDIPDCENSLSFGNVFFNEFFISASGNGFFVEWKQYSFIQSFVEVSEIREWQLFLTLSGRAARTAYHEKRSVFAGGTPGVT